jgi:hypothetical protein
MQSFVTTKGYVNVINVFKYSVHIMLNASVMLNSFRYFHISMMTTQQRLNTALGVLMFKP